MQKDRTKSSRKRLFLEIEEVQELINIGIDISDLKDASYKWVWPGESKNLKTLQPIEITTNECEIPTYSFQELLEKLPKYIDVAPPDNLETVFYFKSNRVGEDENGNYTYRHYLEFGFNEDNSIWIGYKYRYFDSESLLYPFPEKKDDLEIWAWEQGGICDSDWIKAIYKLLTVLIKDKLCKFS